MSSVFFECFSQKNIFWKHIGIVSLGDDFNVLPKDINPFMPSHFEKITFVCLFHTFFNFLRPNWHRMTRFVLLSKSRDRAHHDKPVITEISRFKNR